MFVAQACSQTKGSAARWAELCLLACRRFGLLAVRILSQVPEYVDGFLSLSRSARWGSEWYSTLLWLEFWSVMVGGLDGILMSHLSRHPPGSSLSGSGRLLYKTGVLTTTFGKIWLWSSSPTCTAPSVARTSGRCPSPSRQTCFPPTCTTQASSRRRAERNFFVAVLADGCGTECGTEYHSLSNCTRQVCSQRHADRLFVVVCAVGDGTLTLPGVFHTFRLLCCKIVRSSLRTQARQSSRTRAHGPSWLSPSDTTGDDSLSLCWGCSVFEQVVRGCGRAEYEQVVRGLWTS